MNSLEYIANCRIVYYMGISMLLDIPIFINDELEELIMNYSTQSFNENYEAIKSLYCYEYKNGKFTFSFPKELIDLIKTKMDLYDKPKEMLKIYDAVGFEKTQVLTDYAVSTCKYINDINSNVSMFKQ